MQLPTLQSAKLIRRYKRFLTDIELPNGWKVTKVGEIPTTTTPGTKPVVPVEIELPDGRKITVDVPVIVTPTVRQIVVPQKTLCVYLEN